MKALALYERMVPLALPSSGLTFKGTMDAGDELGLKRQRPLNGGSGDRERWSLPLQSEPARPSALGRLQEQDEHASQLEQAQLVVLESGAIRFFARPRVGTRALARLSDVHRFDFTIAPRNRSIVRRITVGKRRLPDERIRETQWATVDRIGSDEDVVSSAGTEGYRTMIRGVRYQTQAVELARGAYAITAHRDHVHLLYELESSDGTMRSSLLRQLRVTRRASYIAAVYLVAALRVATGSSGGRERGREGRSRSVEDEDPPSGAPSPSDELLADRYDKRHFAPLEPAFLDHEGAQLILIGGADRDAAPTAES